jgi:hypothetical protein
MKYFEKLAISQKKVFSAIKNRLRNTSDPSWIFEDTTNSILKNMDKQLRFNPEGKILIKNLQKRFPKK